MLRFFTGAATPPGQDWSTITGTLFHSAEFGLKGLDHLFHGAWNCGRGSLDWRFLRTQAAVCHRVADQLRVAVFAAAGLRAVGFRSGAGLPGWPAVAPCRGRGSRGSLLRLGFLAARRTWRFRQQRLHRKADALHCLVHADHLHLHDVAHLHRLARILNVLVRQLGNVDQSVLMNAEVDEGAEVRDVRDACPRVPCLPAGPRPPSRRRGTSARQTCRADRGPGRSSSSRMSATVNFPASASNALKSAELTALARSRSVPRQKRQATPPSSRRSDRTPDARPFDPADSRRP